MAITNVHSRLLTSQKSDECQPRNKSALLLSLVSLAAFLLISTLFSSQNDVLYCLRSWSSLGSCAKAALSKAVHVAAEDATFPFVTVQEHKSNESLPHVQGAGSGDDEPQVQVKRFLLERLETSQADEPSLTNEAAFLVAEITEKAGTQDSSSDNGSTKKDRDVPSAGASTSAHPHQQKPDAIISVSEALGKIENGNLKGIEYFANIERDEIGPTEVTRAAPGQGRRIYVREASSDSSIIKVEKDFQSEADLVESRATHETVSGNANVMWSVKKHPHWVVKTASDRASSLGEEERPAVRSLFKPRKIRVQ